MASSVLSGLGQRLRHFRKQRKLTLVQLAKAAKTSPSVLSRMERGQMPGTLDCHVRLCHALGIRIAELYAGLEVDVSYAAEYSEASDAHAILATGVHRF